MGSIASSWVSVPDFFKGTTAVGDFPWLMCVCVWGGMWVSHSGSAHVEPIVTQESMLAGRNLRKTETLSFDCQMAGRI